MICSLKDVMPVLFRLTSDARNMRIILHVDGWFGGLAKLTTFRLEVLTLRSSFPYW